jgi:hypothetical protein
MQVKDIAKKFFSTSKTRTTDIFIFKKFEKTKLAFCNISFTKTEDILRNFISIFPSPHVNLAYIKFWLPKSVPKRRMRRVRKGHLFRKILPRPNFGILYLLSKKFQRLEYFNISFRGGPLSDSGNEKFLAQKFQKLRFFKIFAYFVLSSFFCQLFSKFFFT